MAPRAPGLGRSYDLARQDLLAGWGRCHWCGRPLPPGAGDAHHLHGRSSPVLVRACARCNRSDGGGLGTGRRHRGPTAPGSAPYFR